MPERRSLLARLRPWMVPAVLLLAFELRPLEIVAHAIQPGFKEIAPYAVVLVELDEQRGQPTADEALRVVANLVKPDAVTPEAEASVAIGKRVRVVFQDLADHLALPQFTLADEPAAGRVWRLDG